MVVNWWSHTEFQTTQRSLVVLWSRCFLLWLLGFGGLWQVRVGVLFGFSVECLSEWGVWDLLDDFELAKDFKSGVTVACLDWVLWGVSEGNYRFLLSSVFQSFLEGFHVGFLLGFLVGFNVSFNFGFERELGWRRTRWQRLMSWNVESWLRCSIILSGFRDKWLSFTIDWESLLGCYSAALTADIAFIFRQLFLTFIIIQLLVFIYSFKICLISEWLLFYNFVSLNFFWWLFDISDLKTTTIHDLLLTLLLSLLQISILTYWV